MKRTNIIIILSVLPLVFAFTKIDTNILNNFNSSSKFAPPQVGELFPEIEMLSVGRDTSYKLSALRGKLVLVNFWSSMVAQCRFENPNIVRTYNKFKDSKFKNGENLEIFSISLDTELNKWKNAIKKDKLSWKYHVSDLKGYKSQTVMNLGVKKLPSNFLIDGTGKIIAINLKGADLNKTLQSLVKN